MSCLTGAFVEFACLCDIPFAESGSLANGRPYSIHIISRQDGVQKDTPVIQQREIQVSSASRHQEGKKYTISPRSSSVISHVVKGKQFSYDMGGMVLKRDRNTDV